MTIVRLEIRIRDETINESSLAYTETIGEQILQSLGCQKDSMSCMKLTVKSIIVK